MAVVSLQLIRVHLTTVSAVINVIIFQNLPFRIDNRYRMTLNLSIFMATGFGIPFLMVRHQILKNRRTYGRSDQTRACANSAYTISEN